MNREVYKPRAPPLRELKEHESADTLNKWISDQLFDLSLNPAFAEFLGDNYVWQKKGGAAANRGLADDGPEVANHRTGAQKLIQLEFMLQRIATWIPVISAKEIVERSTSLKGIWTMLKSHYGVQPSGGRFLDLATIKLVPGERYETLYRRFQAFIDENLDIFAE